MQSLYVREWADIQNIVVDKPFHKFVLDDLGANEQDICELLNPETCEKTMHCILYKPDRCVQKIRTHSMHSPSVILKSKSGLAFQVLDSMYLSKVQLTTAQVDMYYCMVRSLQSNVIYVLFSSGIVLTQADLQDNIELNNNLLLLIAKLSVRKDERFVLGGHSMGCVLALYTGYLMQHKPVFYNCFIVGTAGAKWIPQNISFTNLPNIQIFISGELRHSKNGNSNLLLDCFVNEGDANLTAYKPFTVIYYDTEDKNAFSASYDNITYKITYPEKSSSQCKKFHMWSYYQGLLFALYRELKVKSMKLRKSRKSKTQYNFTKKSANSYTRTNSKSYI